MDSSNSPPKSPSSSADTVSDECYSNEQIPTVRIAVSAAEPYYPTSETHNVVRHVPRQPLLSIRTGISQSVNNSISNFLSPMSARTPGPNSASQRQHGPASPARHPSRSFMISPQIRSPNSLGVPFMTNYNPMSPHPSIMSPHLSIISPEGVTRFPRSPRHSPSYIISPTSASPARSVFDVDRILEIGADVFNAIAVPHTPLVAPTHEWSTRQPHASIYYNDRRLIDIDQLTTLQMSPKSPKDIGKDGKDEFSEDTLADIAEGEKINVTLRSLFHFSDRTDLMLICFGTFLNVVYGTLIPIIPYFYAFEEKNQNAISDQEFTDRIHTYALYFVLIAAGCFVVGSLSNYCWILSGFRQYNALLSAYYKSILRQNIDWFDQSTDPEDGTNFYSSGLVADAKKIQAAISLPAGEIIRRVTSFFIAIGLSIYCGWELALILLALIPINVFVSLRFRGRIAEKTEKQQQIRSYTTQIITELLEDIKTIFAYNAENSELERFGKTSEERRQLTISTFKDWGKLLGLMNFLIFSSFSLGYWYGGQLISTGNKSGGNILQVFLMNNVAFGSLSIITRRLSIFSEAMAVAKRIFTVVWRVPVIDSENQDGCKSKIGGKITFKDVHFAYSSRKEVPVLKGLSFTLNAGSVVGFVAGSGGGKSTIVQLLERFFNTDSGSVLVDDVNVRDYNLGFLRSQIAVVTQEPFLFDISIRENIEFGLCDDIVSNEQETFKNVQDACRIAAIHEFVVGLPNGYDTLVGDCGDQLSGGQRQRLVLARALYRKPKILILGKNNRISCPNFTDEATSYLDVHSEQEIMRSLSTQKNKPTTLIIAHRLNSLASVDEVLVLADGAVAERGTIETLKKLPNGIFRYMHEASEDTGKAQTPQFLSTMSPLSPSESIGGGWKTPFDAASRVSISTRRTSVDTEFYEYSATFATVRKALKLSVYSKTLALIGMVLSVVDGLTIPAYAVVFTWVLTAYTNTDVQKLVDDMKVYALYFLGIACIKGLAIGIRKWVLGVTAASVSHSLRMKMLKVTMDHNVAWFEHESNNPSVIAMSVSEDPSQLYQFIISVLPTFLETISVSVTGIIIAFLAGWKLSLAVLAAFPIMLVATRSQGQAEVGLNRKVDTMYEKSERLARESIEAIRTVTAFGLQKMMTERYRQFIQAPYLAARRNTIPVSIGSGVTEGLIYLCEAGIFYFGATLYINGEYSFNQILLVFSSIVFCSTNLGQSMYIIPEYSKVKVAAAKVLATLSPRVPHAVLVGESETQPIIDTSISFVNVRFLYPSRPNVTVLDDFSLLIAAGQTTAFVGTSGCGKSTVLQLIERFFKPATGSIRIGDVNIKKVSVEALRQMTGYLGQESRLFRRTIAENIAFGSREIDLQEEIKLFASQDIDLNMSKVTCESVTSDMLERVIRAAKSAYIHDYIMTLPKGYDTQVGDKGIQLSGGQRQRIALARVILRNPKILLLDEFTSSVDSETERKLMDTIKSISQNRTVVIVAHRLSTIRHAETIVVMSEGRVVEKGSHRHLMAKEGKYYHMVKIQEQEKSYS